MRSQRLPKLAAACSFGVTALALLGAWGTVAQALTISPVLVELSPDHPITSITLSNPGDRPISFQTATLAWTQSDGVDRYAETDELLVVPRIAEIRAGGTQIFRVMARGPAGPQERAYRLVFEDVTEDIAPAPSSDAVSITLRVNHSLPVFVASAGKPGALASLGRCTDSAMPVPAGTGCVRLRNDGNRYLQIKAITVDGANWHRDLGASSRVLAGAWRQWTFELPVDIVGPLHVKAETSNGPVTFELQRPAT